MLLAGALIIFFFFNDTATTEIYTLSLHDALPIWRGDVRSARAERRGEDDAAVDPGAGAGADGGNNALPKDGRGERSRARGDPRANRLFVAGFPAPAPSHPARISRALRASARPPAD